MSTQHPITEEVIRLIRQSIEDVRGSKAAFCRITGISPYNLSKLLSGNKKFVYGDDWNRLCEYFPEIDDRKIKINGHCNAVNGSSVVVGQTSADDAVETFRSGLIAQIIDADIIPEEKVKILKIVSSFNKKDPAK